MELDDEEFKYNFQAGVPDGVALERVRDLFEKVSTTHQLEKSYFNYGEMSGTRDYREAICSLLNTSLHCSIKPDSVFASGGASQGLHFVLNLIKVQPGDVIFVEDPTYFLAANVFSADFHLKVQKVATDEQGLVVEDFAAQLATVPALRISPYRSIIYLATCHNNPTATCLPQERARQLLQLAQDRNVLILCDDVYQLLSYQATDLSFLFDMSPTHSVVSLGSLSKILAPGLRLGWLLLPPNIMYMAKSSGTVVSGGCFNQFTCGIVEKVISQGYMTDMLQWLRERYGKRMDAALRLLQKELPESCTVSQSKGGFYIWLQLPNNVDTTLLRERALAEHALIFLPGARCSSGGSFSNCLRICISYLEEEKLLPGLQLLIALIKEECEKREK